MRKNKLVQFFTCLCVGSLMFIASPQIIKGISSLNITPHISGTPFYSSFESNDPAAATNQFLSYSGVQSSPSASTQYGPTVNEAYNIAEGDYGFTGEKTFKYNCGAAGINVNKSFQAVIYQEITNVQVGTDFVFKYKILPTLGENKSPSNADLSYISSYISVDLLYNDSPTDFNNLQSLAATGATDQYGYGITPKEQGDAKVLYSAQWNSKQIDLKGIVGKYIHSIVLCYDNDNTSYVGEKILGYVDDISIDAQQPIDSSSLTNYVDTRRGTNSSGDFSRGNNIPATAVPNGFNFYTPMTDSQSDWLYSYKVQVNEENLPTLNGIGISHEPSPWMGDREQMNIMPSLQTEDLTPSGRALPFSHDNEIAQSDYYSVLFENNIKTEIAPSSHSAIFRITYPTGATTNSLIIDSFHRASSTHSFNFDTDTNSFSGWVNNKSGMSAGASQMYIYATLSQSFIVSSSSPSSPACIVFQSPSTQPIDLKIATSYINVEQAKKNLELEIGDNTSFDQLRTQATVLWQERLKAINLDSSNATETDKVTMYSNLYRLNLYPNEYFENTGTINTPRYQYRSPVLENNPIEDGKMYVNNGFWDTYRTVWPAYSLLYPNFVNELIDGFLLQYRDSGYVARWSSPGHADSMTGTSSDAAFSDAYISGVINNIDTVINIYKSGMNDAFLYSPDYTRGRKGLNYSQFLGYTPYISSSAPAGYSNETVSWTLEGYINDYALGQLAIKLGQDPQLSDAKALSELQQTKQQIIETGNYLIRRAENFPILFDHEYQFFRAKNRDGNFVDTTGPTFDPKVWGYEFTETDGWNYAFSVPFDVPGLMSLYGGQEGLLNKLDTYFLTPERADKSGSYGHVIHEMLEARDVRMGQLGMSNQPSHHIPYMYAAAGMPYKTQMYTREILQRLYIGSDIGQGYCGDEDNGEMSAWYILSSLGLYDLALGSGQYIMTSPLFNKMQVKRDNGNQLTVIANDNNKTNKYIRSATLDGKSLNDVYINQNQLLNGNHTLSFNMSSVPTSWGSKKIEATKPSSIINSTIDGTLTASDGTDTTPLTDNDSQTSVQFSTNQVNLNWDVIEPITANGTFINMFTLTSVSDNQKFTKIRLLGSDDRSNWHKLADYDNQFFVSQYLTKQYVFNTTKNYQHYQLQLSMDGLVNLSEIQFLSSDYQPNPQTNSGTFWIIFGSIAGVMVLVATAISISVVWSVKKQKHITKTK